MTVPRYNVCTIWSIGETDPITGLPGLASPRVYKCSLKKGGKTKFVDSSGAEFYPKSTFWVRSNELVSGVHSEPVFNEVVAKGDHRNVGEPSSVGAEVIKSVAVNDHAKFAQSESYVIGTS